MVVALTDKELIKLISKTLNIKKRDLTIKIDIKMPNSNMNGTIVFEKDNWFLDYTIKDYILKEAENV